MCLSKNVNDSDAGDCVVPRVHGACGWGQSWYTEVQLWLAGSGVGAPLALVPLTKLRTKLTEHPGSPGTILLGEGGSPSPSPCTPSEQLVPWLVPRFASFKDCLFLPENPALTGCLVMFNDR